MARPKGVKNGMGNPPSKPLRLLPEAYRLAKEIAARTGEPAGHVASRHAMAGLRRARARLERGQ
jgi:hypothetical protein